MADFITKTSEQVRDDYLRTLTAGLAKIGINNANVSEGTLDWLRATALGEFAESIYSSLQAKIDAQLVDTAQGDDLIRLARNYGLSPRPAGGSSGFIVLSSTFSPILIPTNAQLIDPNRLSYKVITGGAYSNGDLIEIIAVDTGASTNIEASTVLRWTSPPPFVNSTALVATGGLSGGVDAENIEDLRARLLEKLRNPPKNSNWAALNTSAEQATTFVQKAFSYSGIYGNGTCHLAVVGRPTATNKSREVSSTVITQFIEPLVRNEHPEHAYLTITGCSAVSVSTVIGLSIPQSTKASPPGPGGGWIDADPWPVLTGPNLPVQVQTSYNSAEFSVLCDVVPVVGAAIAYVARFDFKFFRAKVKSIVSSTPSGGKFIVRIIIDTPFYTDTANSIPISVGEYVFPDADNMETYVQNVFDSFGQLGPTEKTTNPGLLNRAARKPIKEQSWPSQVGGLFLRNLRNITEVDDADFLVVPDVVGVNEGLNFPPFLAVPRLISFYPLTY